MANYDSNYAIAQEISARIGTSPIPFDSVYSICLLIYNELGGEPAQFDSVYEILLGILPLIEGGGSKVIDDTSIRLDKTWSSSKINEEIQAVAGTANSEIEGKETEDFAFVAELPVSGEEDEQVIIKGENTDTLYKYVSGSWVEQTPDATKLYFDTENEALYSYVSADHQFAPVSLVNTIVVGSNLNTNTALKAIKTPGVYSVVQRLHSATKGDYIKNWTLTVEGVDYDEYERTDSIYQRMQSNYTIYKRTWSSSRQTNDGWSSFSTYYAGEIKDSTTSKYYTWSSNKLSGELATKQDVLTPSTNITIDASNNISADGYVFDSSNGSLATIYRQDEEDGGQELVNTASGLGAVAEGYMTTATGAYGSHTEGLRTQATGECAHAEGYETQATGNFGSHAEGFQTLASNQMGHAEGYGTKATGDYGAHAEGYLSEANEQVSHAEGRSIVNGRYGHGEGFKTEVKNYAEHAQGRQNVSHTDGESEPTYNNPKRTIHSIGIGTKDSNRLNAVEIMTNGDYYVRGIGGYDGVHIKTETGYENTKTLQEVVNGKQDVLTAGQNISIDASNNISTLGYMFDSSNGAFAEQYFDDENNLIATNSATGIGAHAEGYNTTASGAYGSHAEGNVSVASGYVSHAEGNRTTSSGIAAHTEGIHTTASSKGAHAEGAETNATGTQSHAEGGFTTAQGLNSHAEGEYTIATNLAEHAEGNYNISHTANNTYGNAGNTQHSVGIGSPSTHKNAFEIMQNGDMYVYGVGGYQGTDTKVQDASIKTLQEYIASLEARIAALEGNTTVL